MGLCRVDVPSAEIGLREDAEIEPLQRVKLRSRFQIDKRVLGSADDEKAALGRFDGYPYPALHSRPLKAARKPCGHIRQLVVPHEVAGFVVGDEVSHPAEE